MNPHLNGRTLFPGYLNTFIGLIELQMWIKRVFGVSPISYSFILGITLCVHISLPSPERFESSWAPHSTPLANWLSLLEERLSPFIVPYLEATHQICGSASRLLEFPNDSWILVDPCRLVHKIHIGPLFSQNTDGVIQDPVKVSQRLSRSFT